MRGRLGDVVVALVAVVVAAAFWLLPSVGFDAAGVAGADPVPPPAGHQPPPPNLQPQQPQPSPQPVNPPAGNFQPNQPQSGRTPPAATPADNFLPPDANVPADVAPAPPPGPSAQVSGDPPPPAAGGKPAVSTKSGGGGNGNDAATAAAVALAAVGVGAAATAVAGRKKAPPVDCDDLWRKHAAALDWERKGWDGLQAITNRSGDDYQKAYAEWQGRNAARHAAGDAVRAAGCGNPD